MSRRRTQKEFEKAVYNIFGDEYTVVGRYVDSHTRVAVKHNKCGNINYMFPNNLLRGATCIRCTNSSMNHDKIKSTEQYKREVYDLVGDEYSVLSSYTRSTNKIKMKHNKCGYIWQVQASSFLQGNRCPKCKGGVRKSPEKFREEFNHLVGDEYTLLSSYVNSKTKVKVKHNKCGHVYGVNPSSFLAGRRCPKCFGKFRKTTQQFKDEVYSLVGNEYTVLSEYKSNKKKVIFKHNLCDKTFSMLPTDFIYAGHRCKWCFQHGSSHGNYWVAKALDQLHIKYIREYKFDDCKAKRKLPFDFYLPNMNMCIEYDGKQHYDMASKYYSEEEHEHDLIKDAYCKRKHITLVRLPERKYDSYKEVLDYLSTIA